jgi:hypothetical protein
MTLELFHQIAEADSAAVRRFVAERGLVDRVRLRNIIYDEPRADLALHGGSVTPAIWDGERLHVGKAACLALLDGLPTST